MFAIKTESIKSYVETPKSLLKEHHNLIALIADNGNHFLAYGIVEGTTLYIDLDAEYEENTLSCFINKQWQLRRSNYDVLSVKTLEIGRAHV